MDGVDGLDVLEAARAADPTRPVIIMTAYGTIDGAIEAVRRGASHYLTKPFKMEEAALCLERALGERGLQRENAAAAPRRRGAARLPQPHRQERRSCSSSTICSSG